MHTSKKVACALGASMLAFAPANAAWEPSKAVEIVVAAGAGGASDQMARMIQAVIQKHSLLKQPVVVSLKGGASGAEALMYMKSSEADPHKFVIAYSLIYTLPLAAKLPFNWRDLTPVSIIALDQFVLWTNAGAPYKTVKEFFEAAKAANPPFKMGGTGSKREDHILSVFMEKKTGAKFVVPALQVRRRGGDPARRQPHRRERQQPLREPRGLARRAGAGAVRLRQRAHELQGEGHGRPVLERHPDLQGAGARRRVHHAARPVPAAEGGSGAGGVLRRPVQEDRGDVRSSRTTWRSRRSSPPS